jgi:predicted component of type VI protein secretion system
VLIVAIICFIILLRKKSRGSKTVSPASPAAGSGIPMKLEVLSGRCLTAATLLHMTGELYIGSGPGCDITFADSKVAPRHARIVQRDNAIFIEDMNSPTGTLIGGMRIQGSNRLRSGDVISVGDSDFCLKF